MALCFTDYKRSLDFRCLAGAVRTAGVNITLKGLLGEPQSLSKKKPKD